MANFRNCCGQPCNPNNSQMITMPGQQTSTVKPSSIGNMQMMPSMNVVSPNMQAKLCTQTMPFAQSIPYTQAMPCMTADMQMLPSLPTGFPTGPTPTPLAPSIVPGIPASLSTSNPPPETLISPLYTPGFLKTLIGKKVRVEFLIGAGGTLVDRTGLLIAVGVSYILIQPTETDDIMMCDIYSIKFVTALL